SGRSEYERDPAPPIHLNKWRGLLPYSSGLIRMNRIPTRIRLALLTDPLAIYLGEFPFEVTISQAYNLKNFVSTAFSPLEENCRPRHSYDPRQNPPARSVRFALDRRRRYPQDQFTISVPAKLVFFRIRNNPNLELGH